MFNILINLNFKLSEVQKYDLVFLCNKSYTQLAPSTGNMSMSVSC